MEKHQSEQPEDIADAKSSIDRLAVLRALRRLVSWTHAVVCIAVQERARGRDPRAHRFNSGLAGA